MAQVLVSTTDDDLSRALGRLRAAVSREGTLRTLRERNRGALTKGQRWRQKQAKAKRQFLCFQRKRAAANSDHFDEKDYCKLRAQDYPYNDLSWARTDDTWEPDLTPALVNFLEGSVVTTRHQSSQQLQSHFSFSRGVPNRHIARVSTEVPSAHVCAITLYNWGKEIRVPVVRSLNEDGSERIRWQFPGGGVEHGETFEAGTVRETREEIGLTVAPPMLSEDVVFRQEIAEHTFVCFVTSAIGGRLKKGDEIVELRIPTYTELSEMVNSGELMPKHAAAFRAFQKKIQSLNDGDIQKEAS